MQSSKVAEGKKEELRECAGLVCLSCRKWRLQLQLRGISCKRVTVRAGLIRCSGVVKLGFFFPELATAS